jgi:hypothetical protein
MAMYTEYSALISRANEQGCRISCIGQLTQWLSSQNILHWSAEPMAMPAEYFALVS